MSVTLGVLMKLIHQLVAQVRAWTDADNEALPRWQRAVLYAIDLGRLGATKLKEDRASTMAAALTYHTLFSLLPTLVLTLVVAQAFISAEQLDSLKGQAVEAVVELLDTQNYLIESDSDQAMQKRSEYLLSADKLDENFERWLGELESVDFRSIGLVGIIVFIYGATKLLSTIESSFNFILRASESRSWYIRLPLYYTTITLAPVVLLAGQWVQGRFLLLLDSGGQATAWFAVPLIYLSPLLTTWLVLLLVFRLLPNATLRMRPAAVGSFISAVMLGVAVQGFALFVRSTGSTSLYGALALLPLFLLLLWIIWQVVLFGLELAVILQMLPEQRKRRRDESDHPTMPDPRLVIPTMAVFGRAFQQGETVEPEALAERLKLSLDTTATLVGALTKAGYLHPVESESRCYTLGRSPDSITMAELLALSMRLGRGAEERELPALHLLDQASARAAESHTLADLIAD